jgi:hypothetical protein
MKVYELIKGLQQLDKMANILVASDEEWNTLFEGITVELCEGENKKYEVVLFGLSGTERGDIIIKCRYCGQSCDDSGVCDTCYKKD